ncbi:hypothetical protein QEP15_22715 [Achromobacter mucicolens]|uniref:hypothetical protein n=1 Tax=Achromobacter mucicolens TaxID=1389922 RepID=UPI002452D6D8|nr:hypothetical protein [Achromobacter mucicolens]WGJ90104.1 hypothetical protein QEP15_22715 [Achromobacter mucicolens]
MTLAPLPLLERLRVDGVIRADHHAAALLRLQALPQAPFMTLGGALVWLAAEGILSELDLDEMFELAVSEGTVDRNATRRQALAEMEALCQRGIDNHVARLARGSLLQAIFSGRRWAWLMAIAGAAAAVTLL